MLPIRYCNDDPEPTFWYEFNRDCWGAQHGSIFELFWHDGVIYSYIDHMDPDYRSTVIEYDAVAHGPATADDAKWCAFGYGDDITRVIMPR